jgi:hypothetical protein
MYVNCCNIYSVLKSDNKDPVEFACSTVASYYVSRSRDLEFIRNRTLLNFPHFSSRLALHYNWANCILISLKTYTSAINKIKGEQAPTECFR